MAEDGYKVTLNVYDLSQGLARQLSVTFLGKAIEGIWHTGLVVYGNEYFFGGGIQQTPAGTTQYGAPVKIVDLGVTHVPQQLFEEYLQEISPRYTAETYNLLHHNCNNFTNEVAQFLVGATIPDYILQLPNEVMSSPMGPMILPMIKQLETTMRVNAVPQAPQFSPAAVGRSTQQVNDASEKDTPTSDAVANTTISDIHPTDTGNTPEKIPENKVNDPLGEARSKVQEEIGKEFATIMATGTLRARLTIMLAEVCRYLGGSKN
ncbi:hypothetical protein MRB53_003776 [Persea americana]|uniref:Uncharacterized protein n=1 Tax=Persea americana TaxID=3435 RepID=A0ACC2MYM9_PERAE|nr:hypothetical protein MRB53_003776 [Persea americana]